MRRTRSLGICVVVLAGLLVQARAGTGLRRDGPRLLWDERPIQLVGYSYYGLLADRSFDARSFLEMAASHNVNFTRFFLILPWPVEGAPNLLPFARKGDRYDLRELDEDCFSRLATIVRTAESLGIVCQVCLFDRCGLAVSDRLAWPNHPYNAARNRQGFLVGQADGYPRFCQTSGPVAEIHAAVVARVVETLGERPNVIYEIINEPYPQLGDLPRWHAWVAEQLRARLAAHGGSKVIASTGPYPGAAIDLFSMHRAGSEPHVRGALAKGRAMGVPVIFSDDGDGWSMYHPGGTLASARRALELGEHFEHLESLLTMQREIEHRPADRLDRISGQCRLNLRSLASVASPILPRPFVRRAEFRAAASGGVVLAGELGNVAALGGVEAEWSRDRGGTWSAARVVRDGARVETSDVPQDRRAPVLARFVCLDRGGRRWPGPAVPLVSARERRVLLGEDIDEWGLLRIRPNHGDGALRAATRGGRACWQVDADRRGKYAYFRLERGPDGTAGMPRDSVVVVEFSGGPPSARLVLEYDAEAGPYTPAGRPEIHGAGPWRRAAFRLAGAAFRGRQNDGADLRLWLDGAPGDLALRSVSVRRP